MKIVIDDQRVKRHLNTILLCIFGLVFYYYSYRYILQYGDSITSVTYSPTPGYIKMLKFVIYFIFLGYFGFVAHLQSKKQRHIDTFRDLLLLSVLTMLMVISFYYTKDMELIKSAVLLLMPIFIIGAGDFDLDMKRLERFVYIFCIFGLIYEIIQIVLYFTIGRVPAIAFKGTVFIRYGGPWDDPNGWGLFLSFYIPFMYYKMSTLTKKIIWLLIGCVMLLVTQSVTSIASCFVAWVVYSMIKSRYFTRQKMRVLLFVLALAVALVILITEMSFLIDFYKSKEISAEGHMASFIHLFKMEPMEFIFGFHDFVGESAYVTMISWVGIIGLLLYITLYVRHIWILTKFCNIYDSSFWKAALMYQIAFFVGSVNLPNVMVFTPCLFSVLLIGLSEIYCRPLIRRYEHLE